MMPVIFLVLGLCIRLPFGKSLMSGLKVGVGFVGLGIITALLTSSMKDPLDSLAEIHHLQMQVFDMGWPAAASVAYNTAVGAFIIPVCLGVNIVLLMLKCTRTVNIDLWNYWHYAFIGAVVFFASESLFWGFFAAVVCYIITLVIADITAPKFQEYYNDMDGISIPQPFCAGFAPLAWLVNKVLDKIPWMNRIEIDAEELKRRFGILGEPLFLGVVVGVLIGCLSCATWRERIDETPSILMLGVKMGAVMELIPRITTLFIEGLKPISDATRELVSRKFKNLRGLSIGMSPAVVIGHPTTLVASIILIPITLIIAVVLPGNLFLPLASLAGLFYVFPLVLPYTKGNVLKTLIVGIVAIVLALYMVTYMAPFFTQAAQDVSAAHPDDDAVRVPSGFMAGSIDFAGSPLAWLIFWIKQRFTYVGAAILTLFTVAMVAWNRRRIVRNRA